MFDLTMPSAELVAEWLTAIATIGLAAAAWLEFPLISKQVKALADQIEASRKADENAGKRLREWNTLEACQKYDFDPVPEGQHPVFGSLRKREKTIRTRR